MTCHSPPLTMDRSSRPGGGGGRWEVAAWQVASVPATRGRAVGIQAQTSLRVLDRPPVLQSLLPSCPVNPRRPWWIANPTTALDYEEDCFLGPHASLVRTSCHPADTTKYQNRERFLVLFCFWWRKTSYFEAVRNRCFKNNPPSLMSPGMGPTLVTDTSSVASRHVHLSATVPVQNGRNRVASGPRKSARCPGVSGTLFPRRARRWSQEPLPWPAALPATWPHATEEHAPSGPTLKCGTNSFRTLHPPGS